MKRIFFIGDIVGRPGRHWLRECLPIFRAERTVDFVVANGENAAGGAGITAKVAGEIIQCGVDAITLGDHVWDQKEFAGEIDGLAAVCRPANLPDSNPGRRALMVESAGGFRLGVFTVLGRQFMKMDSENPFLVADRIIDQLREDGANAVLVEIHAEATSEKIALGWHLDGRVLAVLGTHTHVATDDLAILPGGTAYQTDVGMTGPHRSVLGREIEPVVDRFKDGMPRRFPVAEEDVRLRGTLVDCDESTGLAVAVEAVELLKH